MLSCASNPTSSGNTFTYAVGVQGVTLQKTIVQGAVEDEIYLNNVDNIGVGMTVTGYNIPSGVTVDGINASGTLFISVNQNVTTDTAYPNLNVTGNKDRSGSLSSARFAAFKIKNY